MIKAAIFDMDGVMVNSDPLASLAFEHVIRYFNKVPQYNQHGLIHTSGMRESDILQKIKTDYEIEDDIEILKKIRKDFYDEKLKELLPQPGLFTLLELLKIHNIRLAVASSSLLKRIHIKLDVIKAKHHFEEIVSGEQVKNGKPEPDIFLKTAEQLGIKSSQCVVFEDAESGVLAAHRAGMKIIAVPTEYTKKHDFSKADIVVDSLENVTWEMIEKLN